MITPKIGIQIKPGHVAVGGYTASDGMKIHWASAVCPIIPDLRNPDHIKGMLHAFAKAYHLKEDLVQTWAEAGNIKFEPGPEHSVFVNFYEDGDVGEKQDLQMLGAALFVISRLDPV